MTQITDIHAIRSTAVIEAFRAGMGKRVIIMTEEFPFMIIGAIDDIEGDYVCILVETTHIDQLEGKLMRVHLDHIEVFYIEIPGRPIPRIRKYGDSPVNRGDE